MQAQGALEYLIIIAAVLGISAVVVLFVGGAFIGSSGGADLSKCRLAAANCQKDMAMGLSSTCPTCNTACLDSRGNDVLSGTPGCGDACQQCKKGIMTGGGSTPATGMVAQLTFDEGKGRLIADSSGQANNAVFYGTLHDGSLLPQPNGPSWTTGYYGNAVSLDGINDYVGIGNVGSLTQGTIMLWVRFNRLHTSGTWERIVHGGLTSPWTYHIFNYNDGNGIAFFTSTLRSTTKPAIGTWYHLAMTWDGVNKFVYVNGNLENQGAGAYSADLSNLALGGHQYTYYFSGAFDSFRIFERNMTREQIRAEMNSPIAANRSILDLEFDEGSGTIANDTRMWVKGKSGTALALNGVDDSFIIPPSATLPADLSKKGEWAFEGWVLHDSTSPPYSNVFWGKYHQPTIRWTNTGTGDYLALHGFLNGIYDYQSVVNTPAPTSDVFHHLVVQQSASRGVSEIWVDGNKVASDVFKRIYLSDNPLTLYAIGNNDIDGASQRFAGIVDEWHIYNRSLGDSEIIALYNAHK